MKNISIIGLGYIGLPTALLAVGAGFRVHGTDTHAYILECLKQKKSPYPEKDLQTLLTQSLATDLFSFSDHISPADIYIICVPTPLMPDKSPDLSIVHKVVGQLTPLLKPDDLMILESTIPPKTCLDVAKNIRDARPDLKNLHIAHCPERVLPSNLIYELVHNDRIIGGITPACTQKALEFYQKTVLGTCHTTDATTAELVKLSENAYRDVNIAYANELANICDQLQLNVWEVIALANKHPRVNILSPGPGVGGHCIAVDPWFIVDQFPNEALLIRTARHVNDARPFKIVAQVNQFKKQYPDAQILCLGATYKANVADTRESPALEIIHLLNDLYPDQVLVCDPILNQEQHQNLEQNYTCTRLEEGFSKADLVLLLVEHDDFKVLNNHAWDSKHLIDTRGFFKNHLF